MEDNKYIADIFNRIDYLMDRNQAVNIAIEGNSGAGKSTLAKYIHSKYPSNLIHMDDFFLRPEQKSEERLSEVGGNIDYERFASEVISGLKSKVEFDYQVYNCQILKLDRVLKVQPRLVNIVEGVYSMHPLFVDIFDFKIFLEVDEETQIQRILKRNGESMLNRFVNEWIPMENRYFQEFDIKNKCDLVLRLP